MRPQELEGHTEGEQPLLGTIVQVALQPAPLLITRTHDPRPRLTQLRCMWCVSVSRGRRAAVLDEPEVGRHMSASLEPFGAPFELAEQSPLGSVLELLLEVLHVAGHLLRGLSPHEQRHKHLADAVSVEVELDGYPRSGTAVERFDRPLDVTPNGAVEDLARPSLSGDSGS